MKRNNKIRRDVPEVFWAMDMSGKITPVGNLADPENRTLVGIIVIGSIVLFLGSFLYAMFSTPIGRIVGAIFIVIGAIYAIETSFRRWLNRSEYVLHRRLIAHKWLEPRLVYYRVPNKIVYHPIFFEALCRHLITLKQLDRAYQRRRLRTFYSYVKPKVEKARREDSFRDRVHEILLEVSGIFLKGAGVVLILFLVVLALFVLLKLNTQA